MRRSLIVFLAMLMLVCSLPAAKHKPSMEHFRHVLVRSWNRGGVCRHAALAVCVEAAKYGLNCKMPVWDVTGPPRWIGHTIPVIEYRPGQWIAIDEFRFRSIPQGHVRTAWSAEIGLPPWDCGDVRLSRRPCRKVVALGEEWVLDGVRVVDVWMEEAIARGVIRYEEVWKK